MNKRTENILLIVLIIFIPIQALTSIIWKSATTDEPEHIAAGYYYWVTGDFWMGKENPPLVKLISAVPLLFFKSEHPGENRTVQQGGYLEYVDNFIHHNYLSAKKIIFISRIPAVLLTMIMAYFVFIWSRRLYGIKAGFLALFLTVFSPNILAHSRLAATDMGTAVFMFIAVYCFWRWLTSFKKKHMVAAGITLGLALAAKFTSVILLPSFLIIIAAYFIFQKPDAFKNKTGRFILQVIVILTLAVLTLVLCYGVFSADNYFTGFRKVSEIISRGHSSYLLGNYSETGWRHYFLIAFLVKTSVPVIVLLLICIITYIRKNNKKQAVNINNLCLIIPALLIFFVSSFSPKQIGLRYVLLIYPFLFVFLGKSACVKNKYKAVIISVLCGWYVFSSVRVFPHYLSYFNELAGGPDNGYKYLLDSNIDWGQDLNGLKKYLDEKEADNLILSYCGTGNPLNWGIKYQDLMSPLGLTQPTQHINQIMANGGKEYLAVSLNNMHSLLYNDKTVFNWLKSYSPVKIIGHTIYVYDITNDYNSYYNIGILYYKVLNHIKKAFVEENTHVDALSANILNKLIAAFDKTKKINPEFIDVYNYLGVIYAENGMNNESIREFEKIIEIAPENKIVYKNLGLVYKKMGNKKKAVDYWKKYIQKYPEAPDVKIIKQEIEY